MSLIVDNEYYPVTLIDEKKKALKHECTLPPPWSSIHPRTIVECDACGKQYKLKQGDWGWYWSKLWFPWR